jgi:hypothetical protein
MARLEELGLWPGPAEEAKARGGSVFIHQVIDLSVCESRARRRWVTTSAMRLRVTGGVAQTK